MPLPVHYPIGFPVQYGVSDFEDLVVPGQLYGFSLTSLPTVDGQVLASAPFAVPDDGTALYQGTVNSISAAQANVVDAFGADDGWNMLIKSATEVQTFMRNTAGGPVFTTHDHGVALAGTPILFFSKWDGTGNDLDAGVDDAETDGSIVGVSTGVPSVNHTIGGKENLATGITYTGLQYVVLAEVLADPDEATGQPLGEFYRTHSNLLAAPVPEPGLNVGTEVGTPVYRDTDQDVPVWRSAVALSNDMVITGTPWDDSSGGGRLDGLANITTASIATGTLFATDVRLFTVAIRVTIPSTIAATKGVLVRADGSPPGSAGIGFWMVSSGAIKIGGWEDDNTSHDVIMIDAVSALTEYWLIGVFDLDGNQIDGYVYNTSGTQLATETVAEAGIDGIVASTSHVVGRTTGTEPWNLGGIIHEILTFEGVALAANARAAISDGTDLTGYGTRSRRYEGVVTGIVDLADPTRLWYALGGATAVTVANITAP